jgi:signal transduction histidine kinase
MQKKINKEYPEADRDYFRLTIRDNGIGFEQNHAEIIFELFQRLHGRHEYGGSGIGLTICKKIAENHKGFITAESEPGKGAAFHIFIPIKQQH